MEKKIQTLELQLKQSQETLEQALEQCALSDIKQQTLSMKLINIRKEFDNSMIYYQEEIENTTKTNIELINQLKSFKDQQIIIMNQHQQQNSEIKPMFDTQEDLFDYYYNLEVQELKQLQHILDIQNKKIK